MSLKGPSTYCLKFLYKYSFLSFDNGATGIIVSCLFGSKFIFNFKSWKQVSSPPAFTDKYIFPIVTF